MDRNGIAAAFLFILIVADASNASSFWNIRKLVSEAPTNSSAATHISPSPSPVAGGNKTDAKLDSSGKPSNDSSKLDPNVSNKTDSVTPPHQNGTDSGKNSKESGKMDSENPPPLNQTDTGKDPSSKNGDSVKAPETKGDEGKEKKKEMDSGENSNSSNTDTGTDNKVNEKGKEEEEKKKQNEDKNDSKPGVSETCNNVPNRCKDMNMLVACIQSFQTGSRELVVLVQNEGEQALKVKLTGSTSMQRPLKELSIPKHGTKKINITLADSKSGELILSAGNGECVLHVDASISEGNLFLRFPSYDKLVTPINGAYFLIVTVVIFGGTWACCKFRKRRGQDGIPYQELEMALPESISATNVETADGWDQDWDDDWDEGNAVKSPMGHHLGSISANGLTSRSSNRDGWENDWED